MTSRPARDGHRAMTAIQKIRYVWARAGLTLLVAMPVAMYVMFRPWGVDVALSSSSRAVAVRDDDAAIAFVPAAPRPRGVMLLPGCPVDPRAYVPLARTIADAGFIAAIVKVPYRCGSFPGGEVELRRRIESLRARWLDTSFVLAGHSRGAAHTARIAYETPAAFAAYVLMGTSHPRDHDLSSHAIDVTKIAATHDGVAGEAQFDRRRLPSTTRWVRIEGGNHSQFGYYGYQLFDGRASISREEQQAQVIAALLEVLRRDKAARPEVGSRPVVM
jgi:hypothetical protein